MSTSSRRYKTSHQKWVLFPALFISSSRSHHSCFPSGRLLPETVHSIQARASIQAGRAVTLISVDLTAVPWESNGTVTCVTTGHVFAHAAVQTGVGQALVDFQFAARSCWHLIMKTYLILHTTCNYYCYVSLWATCEARGTAAGELVDLVHTHAFIETRVGVALVYLRLTQGAWDTAGE